MVETTNGSEQLTKESSVSDDLKRYRKAIQEKDTETLRQLSQEKSKKLQAERFVLEKNWRNQELSRTDKIAQTPDWPNREAILEYRQKLRDWPSTEDFPKTRPEI